MRYRAYGVTLESAISFPELETNDNADDDVFFFDVSRSEPPLASSPITYAPSKNDVLTCSRCIGGYVQTIGSTWRFFMASDGRKIVAHAPLPSTDTLRHLLLDNVLPHALNLAGRDALHATAVLTSRGVVAFMGPTGAGKSTLAARFISRGFPLVSDDCLLVSMNDSGVATTTSYSGLRLLPDAVAWLGLDLESTTLVAEYGMKRRVPAPSAARDGQLAALYILPALRHESSRQDVSIVPIAKHEAFSQLIEGSFRVDVDDRVMALRQFDLFAAVAEKVPIRRLHVPRRLDAVDVAFAAVRRDVGF